MKENTIDLVCLSHLRWDFVYQRPQHLLSRFARERRVYFFEEPIYDSAEPRLEVSRREDELRVVVPHLPEGLSVEESERAQRELLERLYVEEEIGEHILWYYTPMPVAWTSHLEPMATVYDCMDELSGFKGAPTALGERERELFARADLVFTGGQSLYEAKRGQHHSVHAFPSSIDREHFAKARAGVEDPSDQAGIARPRLGFFGVIDERLDTGLIASVAEARPDWQFVMIGPVVKIDPAELPRRDNIHYLGGKAYAELPAYVAGWDVALLPFAMNDSTRFISPTKTPEYLAAGRPVVSTPIRDVIRPYGERGLAHIAATPDEFVTAIEAALAEDADARLRAADELLSQTSWDMTWGRMRDLIEGVCESRRAGASARGAAPGAPRAGASASAGD